MLQTLLVLLLVKHVQCQFHVAMLPITISINLCRYLSVCCILLCLFIFLNLIIDVLFLKLKLIEIVHIKFFLS